MQVDQDMIEQDFLEDGKDYTQIIQDRYGNNWVLETESDDFLPETMGLMRIEPLILAHFDETTGNMEQNTHMIAGAEVDGFVHRADVQHNIYSTAKMKDKKYGAQLI